MTPTQLKAFACVVRLGSVRAAAEELAVSEAAVSMHVAHLRKELDDKLFTRTSSGLAFTPGGLRLASRAVEILGLQDRTVQEVSQVSDGRRLLRVAASSLFAEHAAPGLIELFAGRADDLDVELSVRPSQQFPALLAARTIDLTVCAGLHDPEELLVHKPFLNFDVVAVARPDHPLAGRPLSVEQARAQTWVLGPSAIDSQEVVPTMLRKLGVPERNQRIFQSEAAALEEAKRSDGVALTVGFAVSGDLAAGRLTKLDGPHMQAHGRWVATALPRHSQLAVTSELLRFITTPRATQAMVRGAGARRGHFRPSVHVTLWS